MISMNYYYYDRPAVRWKWTRIQCAVTASTTTSSPHNFSHNNVWVTKNARKWKMRMHDRQTEYEIENLKWCNGDDNRKVWTKKINVLRLKWMSSLTRIEKSERNKMKLRKIKWESSWPSRCLWKPPLIIRKHFIRSQTQPNRYIYVFVRAFIFLILAIRAHNRLVRQNLNFNCFLKRSHHNNRFQSSTDSVSLLLLVFAVNRILFFFFLVCRQMMSCNLKHKMNVEDDGKKKKQFYKHVATSQVSEYFFLGWVCAQWNHKNYAITCRITHAHTNNCLITVKTNFFLASYCNDTAYHP